MGAHDPARTEGREAGDGLVSTEVEPPPTCPPSAAETAAYASGNDRPPSTDPVELSRAAETAWEGRQVGRYRIVRTLGQGAFGRVYLGHDEALGRNVAIKMPHAGPAGSASAERRLQAVLAEARKAARLKHPGLVGVLEVGQTDAGDPFLALEYVDGPTLEELVRAGRIEPARVAGIVERVAQAIHHAHVSGLVHRDLKPANILIDPSGAPHVADFGLALAFDPLHAPRGQVAGTYSYMAPEQVRGESHRLDGRTDVWALGVVLYRGLTGQLPFPGRDRAEIVDEILHREPLPPRQVDDTLPRELERICAKCLAARMLDRYQTAADLADDLRRWRELESAQSAAPADRSAELAAAAAAWVAPRGLHAFDAADAAGFLALVPGPRGFDGMPESLRFWKAWAEADKPDASVGLLYGPSGGGKSSFVKAGLLPRLDRAAVCAVAVEATPDGTEARLLAALRLVADGLPAHAGLTEALAELRAGRAALPARTLLIVIDQFEQWLQAHPAAAGAGLVNALRQCDGQRVQALVLVRDDFWMAVSRFFQALEVPLVERVNSGAIELLDARHARAVLQAFGRACGRLTGPGRAPSPEEARFLDAAAAGLAEPDGRVVPVRLSLFIEVVRRCAWTPATLRALGGFDGIGVRFLEEAFDLPSAPPAQKACRRAAQAVLQALLPPPPSLIRRAARPAEILRAAAGLDDRPEEFAALLRVLDGGLRLIAPADPEGLVDEAAPSDMSGTAAGPSYRLAHDYLVGPVRQWIERKAQATRAGRARLLLASTAAAWSAQPAARRLPSLAEWATIAWHIPRRDMTADERRMMRAAARHNGLRFAAAAAVAVAAAVGGRAVRDNIEARERYDRIWTDKRDAPDELFRRLDPYRKAVATRLAVDERAAEPSRRAVASALLYRYAPAAERGNAVVGHLLAAPPGELAFYRDALASHLTTGVVQRLWSRASDEAAEPSVRLRAAAALAALDPHARAWAELAPDLVNALRGEDRADVRRWAALLDPVHSALVPALSDALRSPQSDAATRLAAVEALIELQTVRHAHADALAELLPDAPADTFLSLVHAIQRGDGHSQAVAALARALTSSPEPNAGEAAIRRAVQTVAALAALGEPSYAWPRLAGPPEPLPRSLLIAQLARSDLRPQTLIERLPRARDAAERQGVLLVLAEMAPGASHWSRLDRELAATAAAAHFANDRDSGVHSAAALLLRRLDQMHRARAAAPAAAPAPGHGWFVGPNGHTFAVTGPLEGWMGTPSEEPGHHPIEARHYVRTGRALAVATAETTVAQYRAFLAANADLPVPDSMKSRDVDPETAAGDLLWYEAVRYCNWLSLEAGLTLCYPEPVGEGMTIPDNVLDRPGFRLPTEAEWELFCRNGTSAARPFGDPAALLPRYAWTWLNSDDRVHPVARLWPTRLGLFDIVGNQWEWCHDGSPEGSGVNLAEYPPGTPDRPAADQPPGPIRLGPNSQRYHRGGAYDYAPSWARAGSRDYSRLAGVRRPYNGLRVVRTLKK